MDNEQKKSKISLSKPEDIPQVQQAYDDYIDPTPYQQDTQSYQPQYQNTQYSQPTQTAYQEDTARHLPKYEVQNTYQQSNSPVPHNSPFQNSNYSRMRQDTSTKYCKFCGGIIPFDSVVCTQCGRQVEQLRGNYQQNNMYINSININNDTNIRSNKSRSLAGVLCAIGFFGISGLHRLYTGHIASGLLYFFTYGLFGIGNIVDLVRILQGTFTDKTGKLLKD